jgi:hypothetical protein
MASKPLDCQRCFMRNRMSNGSFALPDIDPSIALAQAMRNDEVHRVLFWQKQEIDAPSIRRFSIVAGKPARGMRNRTFTLLLILCFLLLGSASSFSEVACKPFLSVKSVQEVRPSSPRPLPWRWNATIVADTSFCATRSGNFEVDFVRIKEYSPDLQFTQKFRWSQNQFDVSMELSPDEAVLEFRIGFIAPCVCREIDQLSSGPRVTE